MRPPSLLPAALLLVALFAVGIAVPQNPDFDAVFGVEAWKAAGWGAFGLGATGLFAICAAPGLAGRIGDLAAGAAASARSSLRVVVPVAMGVLFLCVQDRSLSGDGFTAVFRTACGDVNPSNPLTSYLLLALTKLAAGDAFLAVRLTSCLSGVAYAYLAVRTAETVADGPAATATTALLLTAGPATLFFGSFEIYAPLVAAVLGFLLAGLRRIRGTGRWFEAPLVLGVACALHGAALVLVPALIWLALRGRDERAPLLRWGLAFVAPVAGVAAALYGITWSGSAPARGAERFGNALGAEGQSPFLPLFLEADGDLHRYALLDAEHLVGVLNLLPLCAAAAIAVLIATRSRGTCSRSFAFAALCAALLFVLPNVWNVSYGLRRDWDLFSPLGVPLALVAALSVGRAATRGTAVCVTALCLFAFVPVVISNAGGRAERRLFAQRALDGTAQLLAVASPELDPEIRTSLDRAQRRFEADLGREDPHGVVAGLASAHVLPPQRRIAAVEALIRHEPGNPFLHHELGIAFLQVGDRAAARTHLEFALRHSLEARRPAVRRALAAMAAHEGDAAEAERQRRRARREQIGPAPPAGD